MYQFRVDVAKIKTYLVCFYFNLPIKLNDLIFMYKKNIKLEITFN